MNPTAATDTPVAPAGGYQNGGWYAGRQWNGSSFGNPGQLTVGANAGQMVDPSINAASSVAQGKAPNAIASYIGYPSPGGSTPNGGGMGGAAGTGQPATIDLKSIYDSAVTNNPDYKAAVKDLNDKTAAHDAAILNVNDNPFYSESRRVGEQAKVDSAYNADKALADQKIAQMQSAGQIQVNLQQGQYNINRQAYQDQLSNLNFLMSNGGLDNASPQDLASYSVATGIPVDMLSGMKGKANTQLVTSTDSSGNLTIAAVDKNSGKVVNQTVLNGAGKATGGKAGVTATQTRAYTADASTILASVDANYQTINGKATPLKTVTGMKRQGDKLLSTQEAKLAYDQILAKVGDPQLALDAFNSALQSGGYSKWGK